MSRVHAVVATYNSAKDIVECLDSVLGQSGVNPDVSVVDNASSDSTLDVVRDRFPSVRLTTNKTNVGYGRANNQGAAVDHHEYVAFLNPDTLSDPEWLSIAMSVLDSVPNAGACQPKILLYDDRTRLNSKGNNANFLMFGWPRGYGIEDDSETAHRRIPFASGCAALYRTSCLQSTRGFDESYFMYCEDLDLGIRSFLLGYVTIYLPEAVVFHKYRFVQSPQRYFYLERNRLLTLSKIYRYRTLFVMIPAIILSELGVVIKASSEGWLKEKMMSYGSVLANASHILSERKNIQKNRVRSDKDLIGILDGGIDFQPLRGSKVLKIGNVVLESYRSFLASLDL